MRMVAPASPALSREDIVRLVDAFYDKVRRDAVLGPVFNPVVHDWPAHKARLVQFWTSVALGTREYRGNPMAVHRPLPIDDSHFGRWLGLWRGTLTEVLAAEPAQEMYEHALRIATSLRYGMGLDQSRLRNLHLPIMNL
ncbi:group III truncated hemoglobin [Pseudoxanthomonas sangjuensis]|nr:group III truncated hemoglobin [Pseudoxanthomonas sangjuensis]KAF1706641.1 preprotein translocase subunit TatC [Pseudoxanthomonas sangjuensis]